MLQARLALPAALLALASVAATQDTPPPAGPQPPALRAALLDRLADARWSGLPAPAPPAAPLVTHLTFDGTLPPDTAMGVPRGRRIDWGEGPGEHVHATEDGGLTGGALRVGPGLEQDGPRVRFQVPGGPRERVVVRCRVRVTGNPLAGEGSQREALRVVEQRSRGRGGRTHRAARRLDPSGWDRVQLELLSSEETVAYEIQLLHRTGGSTSAVSSFDELIVERTPLSAAELLEQIRGRYVPEAVRGPGHVRVALGRAGRRTEHRDALWLPAGAAVDFPLELAGASQAPRLRLALGAPPQLRTSELRLDISFHPEQDGGAAPQGIELAALELGTAGRGQRGWLDHAIDLAPAAGRRGALRLAAVSTGDDDAELAALVVGTPRIEPGRGALEAPNVLLIGVDTLRADRLSAYGYERPTTPNLERLSAAGVRFDSARAQAPWTLPSFSSTLTSLYPSRHGAGRGGHDEWTGIDPTTLSLAEVFARLGYETVGFVANGLISPQYGLDQGFEAYRWTWDFESAFTDADTVARFVREHDKTPWMCFWHIMDPHLPYATSDALRERFTDPEYDGRFRGRRGFEVPFHDLDPRPGRRWFAHEGPPPPPDLNEADAAFVSGYYDAEVAEMDAAVGRVLDALVESGQWERTAIAFFADHGEGLGDHDHYHHGYTLFEDQVRVPLILRVPSSVRALELIEGSAVERPVACIDLGPTLLEALGLAVPEAFQGVARLGSDAPIGGGYAIEYPTYDSSAQKAWIEGRFKYLHDPLFHTEALYDLTADPGETTDVKQAHPDVVARSRTALDAFRWEELQSGRFHLRVAGPRGARLTLRVKTDDLFDANFASLPALDEQAFAMDLQRSTFTVETTLPRDRLELVFWCRGTDLSFALELDGEPLSEGLALQGDDPLSVPLSIPSRSIPTARREDVPWPGQGMALLWLEAGAGPSVLVERSPEELEHLRALGYSR